MIYHVSRIIAKMLFAPFVRIHVLRHAPGPRKGAWILAANHISHFDPPILSVAARRKIDWMAMRELFAKGWAALFFRCIDTFPTDRDRADRAAVRTVLKRLERGHVVGIFPEGGIRAGATSVLEGAAIRSNLAGLADAAGVPVLPCVIIGTDRLYNSRNWLPFRRTRIWIGFGDAIKADEALAKAARREKLDRDLAEAFREIHAGMQAHFSLTADDLPQTPRRRQGRE